MLGWPVTSQSLNLALSKPLEIRVESVACRMQACRAFVQKGSQPLTIFLPDLWPSAARRSRLPGQDRRVQICSRCCVMGAEATSNKVSAVESVYHVR